MLEITQYVKRRCKEDRLSVVLHASEEGIGLIWGRSLVWLFIVGCKCQHWHTAGASCGIDFHFFLLFRQCIRQTFARG